MALTIFIELGIILAIAFIISIIAKSLKQPIIVGYIIAGILIGSFLSVFIASDEIIKIFSEFGIAFLLFIVGLHLNPKVIKEIGFAALAVGIVQIFITFALGFGFAYKILGFSAIISAYLAVALTFSSTIIITKLLSDKHQLDSLYGKISIGVLILQDLAAIITLMIISSSKTGVSFPSLISASLIKWSLTLVLVFAFSYLFIPKITHFIAKTHELLFLFSIAWCFAFIALFQYLGLSLEAGALVAGITLSISKYSDSISSKIRPLRDFFLIIFFIILGLNLQTDLISSVLVTSVWLSLFVIFLKPLVIMVTMTILGYTKRINFITGITMAQISEFSFIIAALGFKTGQIPLNIVAMITVSGLITITISTYFISYSEGIYSSFAPALGIFERKNSRKFKEGKENFFAVLFGYNRIGFGLLESLKKLKRNYLVVDFNPDVIDKLESKKIKCIYGDASDTELLQEIPIEKTKLFISTIPEFEVNSILIKHIKRRNPNAIVIVIAHKIHDAFELYGRGASYVLLPHFLGGDYVSNMIEKYKGDIKKYEAQKKEHIQNLKKRIGAGQDHPSHEKK